MKDLLHYHWLAQMFRYPWEERDKYLDIWDDIIKKYDPGLLNRFEPFRIHVQTRTLAEQQEYYVSTFDVQASCWLDTGYVLFGEDIKRGIFLANIKKEQESAGNPCGNELPDYLPNILTLLPRMNDPLLAEELVCSVIKPALESMIGAFRKGENIYKGLLEILLGVMEADYPVSDFVRYTISEKAKADFLRSISGNHDSYENRVES